ncbi:MAG TPA: peptidoglycan-binding protein, partial [Herpetosiphonaceae bacterium]
VIEAMEPRFAAIELQLESLADRIPSKADTHEFSIGLLEGQVRQLVARMDQTSEQLSSLAKLYQQPISALDLDFEQLADLVASRTSDALVRVDQQGSGGAAETDYEEIEKRLAKVMRAAAAEQPGAEDLSTMRSGITEVNERLARLESSLVARAEESRRIEAAPLADFTPPPPAREARPADPVASIITAADVPPLAPLPPKRSDAMPENPAIDAPLTAKPFPDAGPVRTALEAKNGPRKRHPGLDQAVEAPPYDPAIAAKPPRPVSSFDSAPEPFASPTPIPPVATPAAAVAAPAEMPASDTAPSANTFIQAHRRAARQATAPGATAKSKAEPVADNAPSSLIGRALARFQGGGQAPEAKTAEPVRERKGVPERKLAGDKQPRGEAWAPEAETDVARTPRVDTMAVTPDESDDSAPAESLLTRYRRPILLAAVLVAATILAANLVLQKLNESAPVADPAPETQTVGAADVAPGLLDAQPMERQTSSLSTTARVIEMVDSSLKTGSIDPMSTRATAPKPMSFAPATATPDLTSAFGSKPDISTPTGSVSAAANAAADAIKAPVAGLDMPAPLDLPATTAPAAETSPVKVELPPEAIGPEPLRQAAANGDARAQFEVAAIFTEGRAVPEDLAQAAIWYERSAAQGFAPAQYRLGNLYENGRGVTKDLQQARLWYQRAAEAGNRMSMHNLAALYAGGELGKQEFGSASEWFEQAAARGMKDSQFNLGMLYARGLGVKQDMQASYKWFSLAAARGDQDAAKARDDIARSLPADEMSRLNAEIAAWKPQVVDMAANYAPIGTWSAEFDPGETITKKEVVLNVQAALTQLGYDTGTPDGVAGPKTAEAIKAFERATGMTEIGAINPRLLAVLGSQPV